MLSDLKITFGDNLYQGRVLSSCLDSNDKMFSHSLQDIFDNVKVWTIGKYDEYLVVLKISILRRQPSFNMICPFYTHTPLRLLPRNPALLRIMWVRLHRRLGLGNSISENLAFTTYAILENFEIENTFKSGFTDPGSLAFISVHQTERSNMLVVSLCMPDLFAVGLEV